MNPKHKWRELPRTLHGPYESDGTHPPSPMAKKWFRVAGTYSPTHSLTHTHTHSHALTNSHSLILTH